jgi:hypothetical protein
MDISGRGPSTARYRKGVLPSQDDPGWKDFKHDETGHTVRMIYIHGPFEVDSHVAGERCEEGWLAVDSNGEPYSIDHADQQNSFTLKE